MRAASVTKAILALILVGFFVAGGVGQDTPVSGTWTVQMTATLPGGNNLQTQGQVSPGTCMFEGTANVIQTSNGVSGSVDVMLVTGPGACPNGDVR